MSLPGGTPSFPADSKVKDLLEASSDLVSGIDKALAGGGAGAPPANTSGPPGAASLIRSLPEIDDYETFDLRLIRVTTGGVDSLVIEASGSAGETLDTVPMPVFQDMGVDAVGPFRTATVVAAAGAPPAALPALEDVGRRLGDLLMRSNVQACFKAAKALADSRDKGLRIRLFTYDPMIAAIPWEIAHFDQDFMALRTRTPVLRYVRADMPVKGMAPRPPVRILLVVSCPENQPQIDHERETNNIRDALRPLQEQRLVELDCLEEARVEAFQPKMFNPGYHVIHFIGHGDYDEARGQGRLFFQDVDGRAKPVPGSHLVRMLQDTKVRFVFLNACQSGRAVGGLAEELVRRGIRAAIGMRRDVRDTVAISFSQEFYRALAEGWPVEAAMVRGRMIVLSSADDIDRDSAWSDPLLFSRAKDGRIF